MGWFKKKTDTLEVYDITLSRLCPICKVAVTATKHYHDKEPDRTMECPLCHIALFGKKESLKKTIKTYESDDSALFGMNCIKEESSVTRYD